MPSLFTKLTLPLAPSLDDHDSARLTVTAVAASIGFGLLGYIIYKRFKNTGPKIPGPPGIPIFGNAFQLDKTKTHLTLLEWGEEYGDVYKFSVGPRTFIVLCSPEVIHEALVQKSTDFAGRPYIYRAQIVNIGQQDIGTHDFTPLFQILKKEAQRGVRAYGSGLERIETITMSSIHDFVDEIRHIGGDTPIDLRHSLYRTLINTLTVLIFGEEISRDDPLIDLVIDLDHHVAGCFGNTPDSLLLDVAPWLRFFGNKTWKIIMETMEISDKFWNDYIQEHKKTWIMGQERGVADALFTAQTQHLDENGNPVIADKNVRLALNNLIVAGTVTTTNSLYGLINILLHHPDVQTKLQAEVDKCVGQGRDVTLADKESLHYTRAVIFELLRYMTINPLAIPHVTTRDTSVRKYNIRKGTPVLMNLWSAHHSDKYWSEPGQFRPERFLEADGTLVKADHKSRRQLLSFGAGVRVCLGETLALNRLFLMLATLMQEFTFAPPENEPLVPCDPTSYAFSVILTPNAFTVRAVPRQ